MSESLSLSEG